MAANSDIPPSQTVKPVDPPPPSDQPTSAMLKADIDSGRTGDKVGVLDPGLSSLGTDDEAAGRPPSPFHIALARYQETVGRWMKRRTEHQRCPSGVGHHPHRLFRLDCCHWCAAADWDLGWRTLKAA